MKKEYRIGLVNGKYGYGPSAYEALINAVGQKKAEIIADHTAAYDFTYKSNRTLYAKNGAVIGTLEQR